MDMESDDNLSQSIWPPAPEETEGDRVTIPFDNNDNIVKGVRSCYRRGSITFGTEGVAISGKKLSDWIFST
jgi:hypothetical protein